MLMPVATDSSTSALCSSPMVSVRFARMFSCCWWSQSVALTDPFPPYGGRVVGSTWPPPDPTVVSPPNGRPSASTKLMLCSSRPGNRGRFGRNVGHSARSVALAGTVPLGRNGKNGLWPTGGTTPGGPCPSGPTGRPLASMPSWGQPPPAGLLIPEDAASPPPPVGNGAGWVASPAAVKIGAGVWEESASGAAASEAAEGAKPASSCSSRAARTTLAVSRSMREAARERGGARVGAAGSARWCRTRLPPRAPLWPHALTGSTRMPSSPAPGASPRMCFITTSVKRRGPASSAASSAPARAARVSHSSRSTGWPGAAKIVR